jgi:hypothetical protein
MSESTLVSSLNSQLQEPPGPTPAPRGEPTQIGLEGIESPPGPAGDRLQLSFQTVERIVATRVQTVVGKALPELGLATDESTVEDAPAPRESLSALIAALRNALPGRGSRGARGRLQAATNRLDRNFRSLTKFLERAGALDKQSAKELRALYRQTRGDLQSIVRDLPMVVRSMWVPVVGNGGVRRRTR